MPQVTAKGPTIVQKIRDSEAGGMQTVKNEDYFHGFIPGNETSHLLKNKGDFLVRQAVKSETKFSQREQFIVSIKLGDNEAKYVPKEQEEGYKKEKEMGGVYKGQLVKEVEYDKMGQKDKDLYVCVEDAIFHFPMKYSRRCRVFYMNKYGFTHSSGLIDYHIRHEYSVDRENKEAVLKKAIRKEQWQLNHEQIDRHKHLGDGAFGEVFLGSLRLGLLKTVPVAVKTISGTVTAEENAELFREAMRMKRFKHPNIVTFYGVASNQDPIMIVMEYCPADSLLDAVKKKEDPLPMAKRIKYIHDASLGVQYLAQENVVHRDLAARNCLISKEGVAKISDFGLTIVGGEKKEKKLSKVPVRYLAPQTFYLMSYNLCTDMWSFGCLVYEVFTNGKELYDGKDNDEARKFVKTGKRLGIEAGTYPAFLWTLTKRCWAASTAERITAEQFVEVIEKEDQKHNGGKWFRCFKSLWNDVEMAPAVDDGWKADDQKTAMDEIRAARGEKPPGEGHRSMTTLHRRRVPITRRDVIQTSNPFLPVIVLEARLWRMSPLLLSLLVLICVSSGSPSSPRRRRIVDLVFDKSVLKSERVEMLPPFAEMLPIQVHLTTETDCRDIVKELKSRGEDDFLVLVGVQRSDCPKEICKKNFASIVLSADKTANRTVSYGCEAETQSIEWKTISTNIRSQQKDNLLDEIPEHYSSGEAAKLDKMIVAAFAVMGLAILGLFLLLVVTNIKHSKEVKALKKGPATDEPKKKTEGASAAKTADSTTTDRSTK